MAKSDKEAVERFLAAAPDDPDLEEMAAAAVRTAADLDAETQTELAKKLAALEGKEGIKAARARLAGHARLSLPAWLELAREMSRRGEAELEARHLDALERWRALCEDQEGPAEELPEFFGLPEDLQQKVLDHLALWMQTDLLARLKKQAPDKKSAKKVAKAMHRVKSAARQLRSAVRGEPAQEEEPAGLEAGTQTQQERYDEAYITPPDAMGFYVLNLYRTIYGSHQFISLVVGDLAGVVSYMEAEVEPVRFRRIIEATRKNPQAVVVGVDPGFVRWFIKKAEQEGRKRGVPQKEEYLANRRRLGIADQQEVAHPAWSLFNREELKKERGLIYRAEELTAHRIFEGWEIAPPREADFFMELAERTEGLVQLTPEQKAEQEQALFEKEAKLVLEEQGREIWRDRLLSCAFVLHRLEEKELARIAAATAVFIEDENSDPPPLITLLLRRFADRVLERQKQEKPPPSPDRGGIVVP